MVITSVNNEYIKKLCKLKEKKYRDMEKMFLVEGYHLVMEAYNAKLLDHIILLEGEKVPIYDIDITYVSIEVMKKLSDVVSGSHIIGIVKKKEDKEIGNRILILDDIQDPGNLGTMIRSARAFDFDTIVLGKNGVDLYNPKVVRSTQGMLFYVNILVRDLGCFINNLKEDNYVIYGSDVRNGIDVREEDMPCKIAIVIGNEGNGISDEVKKLCDKNLYIKMSDEVESLNAGVAASILMYEVDNK